MTGAVTTVDAWHSFSNDYALQQAVSGVYGVDFRVPEPAAPHRRVLRMLSAVNALEPKLLKRSGEFFDWDADRFFGGTPIRSKQSRSRGYSNASYSYDPTDSENSSTPRAEVDTDVELVPESDTEATTDHEAHSDAEVDRRMNPPSISAALTQGATFQRQPSMPSMFLSPSLPTQQNPNSRKRAPSAPSATYPNSQTSFALSNANPYASSTMNNHLSAQESFTQLGPLRASYGRRAPPTGPASESGLPMSLPTLGISIPSRPTRSEPDTAVPQIGGKGYSVGPYGYRYPMHPPYPSQSQSQTPVANTSASGHQHQLNDVSDQLTTSSFEHPPALVPAHPVPQHAQTQGMHLDFASHQQWSSGPGPGGGTVGNGGGASGMEGTAGWGEPEDMSMDVDLGGWGRISDPLPGMQMQIQQPAIHPQHQMQRPYGSPYVQPMDEGKFGQGMVNYGEQQNMGYYGSAPLPTSMPNFDYSGWRGGM